MYKSSSTVKINIHKYNLMLIRFKTDNWARTNSFKRIQKYTYNSAINVTKILIVNAYRGVRTGPNRTLKKYGKRRGVSAESSRVCCTEDRTDDMQMRRGLTILALRHSCDPRARSFRYGFVATRDCDRSQPFKIQIKICQKQYMTKSSDAVLPYINYYI